MAEVKNVPFFSTNALVKFLDQKKGDYQRTPLLVLSAIFSIGDRFLRFTGYDSSRYIALGAIGGKLSAAVGYWELVDICQGVRKAASQVWPEKSKGVKGADEPSFDYIKAAQAASFLCLKVISNSASFITTLHETKVITASSLLTPLKFWGSLAGTIYYSRALLTQLFSQEKKELEEIKTLNEEAKGVYRAQHEKKNFSETIIIATLVAFKVLALFSATHALYGKPKPSLFARWEGDLNLLAFAAFAASAVASHFFGEQMKAFRNEKSNQLSGG